MHNENEHTDACRENGGVFGGYMIYGKSSGKCGEELPKPTREDTCSALSEFVARTITMAQADEYPTGEQLGKLCSIFGKIMSLFGFTQCCVRLAETSKLTSDENIGTFKALMNSGADFERLAKGLKDGSITSQNVSEGLPEVSRITISDVIKGLKGFSDGSNGKS